MAIVHNLSCYFREALWCLIGGYQTGMHSCLFRNLSMLTYFTQYRTSGEESCAVEMTNTTTMNVDPYGLTTNQRIAIYGGIICSTVFLVFSRTILSYLITIGAARHLHSRMFKAILRSPILFFDTNPIGMFSRRNDKERFYIITTCQLL